MSVDSRVTAVIPAHNEGPRIASVVSAAARYLPVIVVDDGSSDDTALRAAASGADVVTQRPNQGKGAALRVGFERALTEGAGAVLTLDADGQHDPAEIPAFLAAWRPGGLDLVIGQRDFTHMPLSRRVANRIGGLAFSWAVGRQIPDNQSGYRLLSRRLAEATLASNEAGFEYEVEMIATAIRSGWAIGWLPIRTIYSDETSHIRPLQHFVSFVRMLRAARRMVRGGSR
jgi:glycosyltransferase involved in cell wall biosynthesis